MDFIWDPNMDTAVLILRVHIGRPSFRDKISFRHDFPFYDFTYDIRLTHLTTHSFIPHLQELQLGHLLGQKQQPPMLTCLSVMTAARTVFLAAVFLSLTRMRLRYLRTRMPYFT